MDIHHTAESYTACLVSFMFFIDGVDYDTSTSFSEEQLLAIAANQVAANLNLKALTNQLHAQATTPHGQSNSLAFQKKTSPTSCFFAACNWITSTRGATYPFQCCQCCHNRREGVASAAHHPLEWDEFFLLLVLVRNHYADSDVWFFLATVFCLQCQIIGRIDDVMKLARARCCSTDIRQQQYVSK